jgi:NhaP-type Na+/H+ or K+/H+ antiporter
MRRSNWRIRITDIGEVCDRSDHLLEPFSAIIPYGLQLVLFDGGFKLLLRRHRQHRRIYLYLCLALTFLALFMSVCP